jgi:protein-tyrosine phosphatase
VIPGLDDGPETMEESLEMCKIAYEDGTETLVATPHVNPGVYDNDWNSIKNGHEQLLSAITSIGLPIKLGIGADVRLTELLMFKTDPSEFITINQNNKYMLLEFPDSLIPPNTDRFLFELQLKGITPIITHPERNHEMQTNPNLLYRFVRMGCVVQVTAMSFTGGFGEDLKDLSELFLAHNMVHVVASDGHSTNHRLPLLGDCYEHITRIAGEKIAQSLFIDTPGLILEGKEIYPEEPVEILSRHYNMFNRGIRKMKRWFNLNPLSEDQELD